MKASVLKERNSNIAIGCANKGRKALYLYLKSLKETAVDIFHGNHDIDGLDVIYLEDADYGVAFDNACAVFAYKSLNIYGAGCEIEDFCIFKPLPYKDYEALDSFLCCELAYEYGRQLHYIIAKRAQEEIESD